MCVIIHLKQGVEMPLDKLEIASDINKDGFGLSWVEKGRIKTIREVVKNEAKLIHKELLRLGKHELFLHLRHSTVGKVDLTNSHPFFPLDKSDGIEVGFMHNGTLSNYCPVLNSEDDGKSDTYMFSSNFLRPFLVRMKVWHDQKKGKKDPFLSDWVVNNVLMSKIGVGGGSVFVLFDNLGNHLIVNKSKGNEFETEKGGKWWASNDYSFNDYHTRSSKWNDTNYFGRHNRSITQNNSMFGDDDGLPWTTMNTGTDIINLSTWEDELNVDTAHREADKKANGVRQDHIERVASILKETQAGPGSMATPSGIALTLDMKRTPFIQQAGLVSVDELFKLTRENFDDLFCEYPKAMADAFIDVILENKKLKTKIRELEAQVPAKEAA